MLLKLRTWFDIVLLWTANEILLKFTVAFIQSAPYVMNHGIGLRSEAKFNLSAITIRIGLVQRKGYGLYV